MHLSSVYARSTAPTIFPGMNYLGKSSTAFFVWYFPHVYYTNYRAFIVIFGKSASFMRTCWDICFSASMFAYSYVCRNVMT